MDKERIVNLFKDAESKINRIIKNKMKQTALEKFIEQIKEYDFAVDTDEDYYIIRIPASVLKEKVEEAEKEEKQNIIDAWESGYKEGAGVNDFSIYHGNVYYNNTFKKI